MLICLRCDCGGSEGLIRRALQRGNVDNWLNHPIYVGKERSLEVLSNPNLPQDDIEIRSLKRFIKSTSKFAVILGIKGDKLRWANLSDGSPSARLDAEVIVDKLA